MMKQTVRISLYITFVLISYKGFTQNEQKFLYSFLNGRLITKENVKRKYLKFTLHDIIVNDKQPIYGFEGNNKKRIDVKFLSVIHVPSKVDSFLIYGKINRGDPISKKRSLISDFQGTLIIDEINEYKNLNNLFLIKASYEFFENTGNKIATIKGKCFLKAILKDGRFESNNFYDIFYASSDSNNPYLNTYSAYIGTWSSNRSDEKVFNWGDFMPPEAGSLNIGGSVFKPNPKYINNGWKSLIEDLNQKGGVKFIRRKKWWNECD